jgi:outer membrane protein TolC
VRALEQLLTLANERQRIGRGDEYDLSQVQGNLEAARDSERQMALGYEQALRALEILIGRYPAATVEVAQALPAPPAPVPVGLPSELLERRPDVVAAERKVAAAFHRISEAKAARLPRLSLTASVSNVSSDLFVLKNGGDTIAGIGLGLVYPIFNGYALEAQVEIRSAEQKLAIADYGRVALRAFGEVEGALSAGFAADERAAILARAVASHARTLELAQVRYRVGSGDLRAVLQQGITLYAQRMAELRMHNERLVQRVNLHLALGGSFDLRPEADTPGARIDQAAVRFVSTRAAPKN